MSHPATGPAHPTGRNRVHRPGMCRSIGNGHGPTLRRPGAISTCQARPAMADGHRRESDMEQLRGALQ